ncbi:MAG: thiol-disulfide oxidoreductase DCC family protein [Spirosomataceae bacterium]
MIILFDGVCNLCNAFVNFVIDRDSKKQFKFAALQSPEGQRVLEQYNLQTSDFQTVVLLKENQIYKKSDAALTVAKHLDGFWKYAYIFKILPRFFRDFCYDFIARNRYRFFGKKDVCRIPTPELKERFL